VGGAARPVLVSVGFWWWFALVRLGVGVGASVSPLLGSFGICPLASCPGSFGGRFGVFGVAFSFFSSAFVFCFFRWLYGVAPGGLSWGSLFLVAPFDGFFGVFVQFLFLIYIFCHSKKKLGNIELLKKIIKQTTRNVSRLSTCTNK